MDFFIIANAWSAGKDNPTSKHRIALELVRQGHRVLWIEGSGMRTPSVGSSSDRLRMAKKVLAAFRGARAERGIRTSNSQHSTSNIEQEGAQAPDGSLLNVDCSMLNVRCSPPSSPLPRVVYHCVDRWDAFAMYDSAMMGEMDRRCCRTADLVIASAGELYDRCKAINPNTVLIPHGVDWEHFRRGVIRTSNSQHSTFNVEQDAFQTIVPPPLDVECSMLTVGCSRSSRPIIGFFGLLSEWVDQELLLRLAREFPGATLQLIGKADVDVSRLKVMPNIELTGPKPFAELPDLIARFTVGIIPFTVNDLTRSVNPIKLREMLSAGCPVVSTALPEVERIRTSNSQQSTSNIEHDRPKAPDGSLLDVECSMLTVECSHSAAPIQVAHNHDEFVEMVRKILEEPLTQDQRLALSQSMAGETWTAKVREIVACVNGVPAKDQK